MGREIMPSRERSLEQQLREQWKEFKLECSLLEAEMMSLPTRQQEILDQILRIHREGMEQGTKEGLQRAVVTIEALANKHPEISEMAERLVAGAGIINRLRTRSSPQSL